METVLRIIVAAIENMALVEEFHLLPVVDKVEDRPVWKFTNLDETRATEFADDECFYTCIHQIFPRI